MNENIIIGIILFIFIIFGLSLALKSGGGNPKLNIYGEVPRSERYIFNLN